MNAPVREMHRNRHFSVIHGALYYARVYIQCALVFFISLTAGSVRDPPSKSHSVISDTLFLTRPSYYLLHLRQLSIHRVVLVVSFTLLPLARFRIKPNETEYAFDLLYRESAFVASSFARLCWCFWIERVRSAYTARAIVS